MSGTGDIEDFITDLPGNERLILNRLRALILKADPHIRERLSFGVPYFFRYRRVFFLWPASALPSPKKMSAASPAVVTLGFCYGSKLSNNQGLLVKAGRKQVRTVSFSSLTDIDKHERALSESFAEALIIDKHLFKK